MESQMSTTTLSPRGEVQEPVEEVLEGEVVETFRRRERNETRTARATLEVLPPDVQTKVSALSTLDGQAQASAVTAMLSHSRTGLLAAIAAHDLPQIVEWKAKGAAVQEIAKQLQLGKDMQLDAAEFIRRAERGLGVAIREGQDRGEVLTKGQSNTFGNAHTTSQPLPTRSRPAPTDFATSSELFGAAKPRTGIYAMTDGVSDEEFEEALAEAKAESNLSRANVARKARAKSGADQAPKPDVEPVAPKQRAPKHNSSEMVENISGMLQSIVQTLDYIEANDVDRKVARKQIPQIFGALNKIRLTAREIKKVHDV